MELVLQSSDRLRFAIPKKGRLHEKCLQFLEGADIKFSRDHRSDIALSTNLPVALIFLPASDIPTFVVRGNVDLGITGLDVIEEKTCKKDSNIEVNKLLDLDFGKCKLQVQVPANGQYQTVESLIGKRIVTSFENVVCNYFGKLEGIDPRSKDKIKTDVDYIGGSVEAACALGVADGIVDLVESGETMRAAGLKAIATVMETSCWLIQSKNPQQPDPIKTELVDTILSRIQGYMSAQKYILCEYNVPYSKLNECVKIAPGKRSPTVQNLLQNDGEEWRAVSVMVLKKDSAQVMDKLAKAGAHDILAFEIKNSRA